jgi:AraC-like DNA-binding protein
MSANANTSKLTFWKLKQLEGVDFLYGEDVTHYYPPHLHGEFGIELVVRGTETTVIHGESHTAFAGDLILLNPDEVHSTDSRGAEYKLIRIGARTLGRIFADVAGDSGVQPYFPRLVVRDCATYTSLARLLAKLEQNLSFLEQESEFISTISRLVERQIEDRMVTKPAGKEPDRVEVAREYIRAHYSENISLSELSSVTDLSPYHLLRTFRRQIGVPPHEFQTQVRIAHARRLLSAGHAISDAAVETGFCDQSHFSRNFKRIVAMTPGRYLSESNIVQD